MDAFLGAAYLIAVGAVVVFSISLGLMTWEHRRYARSCMRGLAQHRPAGHVRLFAPCKGIDLDFETNLRALLEQDYGDYEVTFIVESIDDPAHAIIHRVIAAYPNTPTQVMIAGRATDCGQKVHNLRVATQHLSPRVEYLAFVDSDACPRREWLRSMVAQLDKSGTGVVTGYRWFTPNNPTVANALVYSMNCDMVSLLTHDGHYLIWGGSWAIRRDVFDEVELQRAWEGTLSDDLVASRLMRRLKKMVRFEPSCVVASPLDVSLWHAIAFIRRQYLITRLYTFNLWLFSLLGATFMNGVWLGNLGIVAWCLLKGTHSPWIPAAVSAILYLVTVCRGWLRQSLVKTYFPDWNKTSRFVQWVDILGNPLVELAHWMGILISAFGYRIHWRGIRYDVSPGGQVRQIVRAHEAEPPAETPASWPRAA